VTVDVTNMYHIILVYSIIYLLGLNLTNLIITYQFSKYYFFSFYSPTQFTPLEMTPPLMWFILEIVSATPLNNSTPS
jgi:hypothetical protein